MLNFSFPYTWITGNFFKKVTTLKVITFFFHQGPNVPAHIYRSLQLYGRNLHPDKCTFQICSLGRVQGLQTFPSSHFPNHSLRQIHYNNATISDHV